MTDSRFQPGTYVWYASEGLGRVQDVGESLPVLFWKDKKSGTTKNMPPALLTPLSSFIPEAEQWSEDDDHTSKKFESGIKKAPLTMVAIALHACGGSADVLDIREKLDKRVPIGAWGAWWKRTEPKVRKLQDCFSIDETEGVPRYSLNAGVSVSDVPPDLVKSEAEVVEEWIEWLHAAIHQEAPGRSPITAVADYLTDSPAENEERAERDLRRLISGTEDFLSSTKPSSQDAGRWLSIVCQVALRWREISSQDTRGYLAADVGRSLTRLALRVRTSGPLVILPRAGDLDGNADAWRQGFLAGMWGAFSGDDAHGLYVKLAAGLGRQARGDLARKIFLAAFDPEFSERRHSQLDRLLDALPDEQRLQLLREAIASVPADQRSGVANYIASTHHAAGPENLELRMVAALTLAGEQSDLAKRTSREVADLVADLIEQLPRIVVSEGQASFLGIQAKVNVPKRPSAVVLEDVARKMREEIAEKDREIEELRESYDAELESERRDKERFLLQAQELGAEVDSLQNRLRSARQGTAQAPNDQDR